MSQMTGTGNLVRDPAVKQAGNNKSVLNITIAENFRANRDAEEVVTYVDVTLWDSLAENFGASVMKGDRVFATGRVRQERWESTSGEKRSKLVIVAESAGVYLRFHTADATQHDTTTDVGVSCAGRSTRRC